MSIFRLEPIENTANGDYGNIEALDITVSNVGTTEFDILIQGHQGEGMFLLYLYNVKAAPDPSSTVNLSNLPAQVSPLSLQFVTNLNDPEPTRITVNAKNRNGDSVAVYTDKELLWVR
jgi:hypothetical protein